jgi:hypothetical protein
MLKSKDQTVDALSSSKLRLKIVVDTRSSYSGLIKEESS